MNRQLKVLLIEDNENDAILTLRYLKQHWAEVKHLQVYSIDKLTAALKSDWDVILSDLNLPGFDGMTALRIIRESGINTPFILISGEVSEDVASLMMRLGANDYVMKDNLNRLAPAILRELKLGSIKVGEVKSNNE